MSRIPHRMSQADLPRPLQVHHTDDNHLSSFTLDTISQLDEDASTALATIREWRNSLVPINRIPPEILSLVPTHLSSQKDRFNATFVCRYWRKANLRHGALWTQIFLRNGEDYVTTLLERARHSPLDIVIHRDVPATIISQISTLAQQIRHLEFSQNDWQDVITFSELNSGQLPLLRTLKIAVFDIPYVYEVAPPSLPFFRGSANLEEFSLRLGNFEFLSLFIFPNLTKFELSSYQPTLFNASFLLNFLRASPMLRVVKLDIDKFNEMANDTHDAVAMSLPNAETFSLRMYGWSPKYIFKIAAHIQCPSARDVSLRVKMDAEDVAEYHTDIFPFPDSWDRIGCLYAISSIEEVVVEMKREPYGAITFSVTFLSLNASAIRLGLELSDMDEQFFPDVCWGVFCQALTTARKLPLVSHIKRLRIEFRAPVGETIEMADRIDEFAGPFSSLGPWDRLTIHGCDIHILLSTSTAELPHIKKLVILHPWMKADSPRCMNSITRLAMNKYGSGVPFACVTIYAGILPTGIVEKLKPWVGVVRYRGRYTEE